MIQPELWALITTTFIFGLSSSLHCVTMCGPLICVVQAQSNGKSSLYLYQIGRLLSYALLGAMLGWLGKGANAIGEMKQIQSLSAILSLSLLCLVGLRLVFAKTKLTFLPSFNQILSPLFQYLKSKKLDWALGLTLGLFSAFLPCGILYPAYAVAFASGKISSGGLIMLGFFFGTFPTLFGFSLGIRWLQRRVEPKYAFYAGMALIVFSLLFLVLRVTHTVHSENCEHTDSSSIF